MSDSGKKIRILVLYSEVMPYTLSVLEQLSVFENAEIILVYWDEGKLTPFTFNLSDNIQAYPRSTVTQSWALSHFLEFSPDIVWTSGRMDALYLKLNLEFKKKIPQTIRVTGSDNQWEGTWKDWLRSILGYPLYRKYFTHCWVPGPSQMKFAQKIGFPNSSIAKNLLTCSNSWFNFSSPLTENRILFVGRLVPNKNLQILIDAFESLPEDILSTTYLRLVGSGDPLDFSHTSDRIEFYPFDTQERLIQHGLKSNLFCLPSIHEPYGVVVHEFAALGLPLLLSDQVGSLQVFLQEGKNGYRFSPNNAEELRNCLIDYYGKTLDQKVEMGKVSKELALRITPSIAATSLLNLMEK